MSFYPIVSREKSSSGMIAHPWFIYSAKGLHSRACTISQRPALICWPWIPPRRLRSLQVDRPWDLFVLEKSLLVKAPFLCANVLLSLVTVGVTHSSLRLGSSNAVTYETGSCTAGSPPVVSRPPPRGQLAGRPGRWWLRTPGSATQHTFESLSRRNLVFFVLYPSSATDLSRYHHVISTCGG